MSSAQADAPPSRGIGMAGLDLNTSEAITELCSRIQAAAHGAVDAKAPSDPAPHDAQRAALEISHSRVALRREHLP